MKRILCAVMMALSACAWAETETYGLTLAIQNFKYDSVHKLPSDAVLKLIDTKNNVVLAQVGVNQLGEANVNSEISKNGLTTDKFTARWDIGTQLGSNYLQLYLTGLTFESGTLSSLLEKTHSEGGHTYADNVSVVASSATAGQSQALAVEISGAAYSLSSSAEFAPTPTPPQPVPEPTSAVVMLLGVAGLMLKRKRA